MVKTFSEGALTSRAFTLIELLVVITIIALLVGLILAGMGMLRDKAEVIVTNNRIQEVAQLVQQSSGGADDLQDLITGRRLRFETLRTVLTQLTTRHGVDLKSDFERLPPGLASIYDVGIGCYETENGVKWMTLLDDDLQGLKRKNPVLDNVIVWRYFQDFTDLDPFELQFDSPTYFHYGRNRHPRTFWWWHKNEPALLRGGDKRSCMLFQVQSKLQEQLDATMEVLPDGDWLPADYLAAWPLLSETGDREDPVQHAWPDSDWDQAIPGTVPPVWEAPFGRPIIGRLDGELLAGRWLRRQADGDARTLGDCSPLASLRILHALGVAASPADYRENRSREAAWNDRWGNPLVVASALWLTPRYGRDPAPPADASHGLVLEHDSDLKGGRDWLRRRAQEIYGATSEAYLVTGAMGPVRGIFGDDNPIASTVPGWEGSGSLRWEEEADPQVLRAAWLQVRESVHAERFRDDSALDPPWHDTTRAEEGPYLILCSGLITVR